MTELEKLKHDALDAKEISDVAKNNADKKLMIYIEALEAKINNLVIKD